MSKVKQSKKRICGPQTRRFIRNCVPTPDTKTDWEVDNARACNFLDSKAKLPARLDLREPWWPVRDQGRTGACVGFAIADGVLRWLYARNGLINPGDEMSPRFIWMANKELDDLVRFPTTFLEASGTTTKSALKIAKKYGCVPENMLQFNGKLSLKSPAEFYAIAAHYRIESYFNLWKCACSEDKIEILKQWLAQQGPILVRIVVDSTFEKAKADNSNLDLFNIDKTSGGHAVCLVGYCDKEERFIMRNSWGPKWGRDGFAFARYDYISQAVTEAYGAVLNRPQHLTVSQW